MSRKYDTRTSLFSLNNESIFQDLISQQTTNGFYDNEESSNKSQSPSQANNANSITYQQQQMQLNNLLNLAKSSNANYHSSSSSASPSEPAFTFSNGDGMTSNLNQLLMASSSSMNSSNGNNEASFNNAAMLGKTKKPFFYESAPSRREVGFIEKLVNSYGFVKCLDRDGRLFFHSSSFQPDDFTGALKVGDYVEFEESVDKRTGKPIAINVIRYQTNDNITFTNNKSSLKTESNRTNDMESTLNLMNLKELLLKNNGTSNNAMNGIHRNSSQPVLSSTNTNSHHYQTMMNGLKLLNIQSLSNSNVMANSNGNDDEVTTATSNLNSIMNLFTNGLTTSNNANQDSNFNSNLLNMVKTATNGASSSSTSNSHNIVSKEPIEGTISLPASKRSSSPALDGRISCSSSGETFYIPYSLSDVSTSYTMDQMTGSLQPQLSRLNVGDRVRFFIAQKTTNNYNSTSMMHQTNSPSTYYAHQVELISEAAPPTLYRGIITSLKDSFGRIEREDARKETFFHFTEYRGGNNALQDLELGLNVEFEIQDKFGKENACNIRILPTGTVTFDELSRRVYIGRIIQAPTMPTLVGRLIFDNNEDKLAELTFGERDRAGSCQYTLLEGDFVQFRIASDKRTRGSFRRATQITLIEEHSLTENSVNTKERRVNGVLVELVNVLKEQQTVSSYKESKDMPTHTTNNYGAIKTLENNAEELIYFPLSELVQYARFSSADDDDPSTPPTYDLNKVNLETGDSVEFSLVSCPQDSIYPNGLRAIRVRQLTRNSVQLKVISSETYTGTVEREAQVDETNTNSRSKCGSIKYGSSKQIDYYLSSKTDSSISRFFRGDKIQFNTCNCLLTKRQYATKLKLIEPVKHLGYVTMLSESLGCIELNFINEIPANEQREFYFDVKEASGDLELGDEVEFTFDRRSKASLLAENVTLKKSNNNAKSKSTSSLMLTPQVYKGSVIEEFKLPSSDQQQKQEAAKSSRTDDSYYGKITVSSIINEAASSNGNKKEAGNNEIDKTYAFGMFSIMDKTNAAWIKQGAIVTFQLGQCADGIRRPFNIKLQQPKREIVRKGRIDSIKGHNGFIECQGNEHGKKLFFHISDFEAGSSDSQLKVGDEVEFVVLHNSRSNKYSAIKLKKLSNGKASKESSQSNEPAETAKRPEHLITKLKTANIDNKSGKQLILCRQPNNPDGKSVKFSRQLYDRTPGSLEPININNSNETKTTNASSSNLANIANSNAEEENNKQTLENNEQSFKTTRSITELLETLAAAETSELNDTTSTEKHVVFS